MIPHFAPRAALAALALLVVGCTGGETDDTGLHEECGEGFVEADGECVCDDGLDEVDGACVDEQTVACADDAPANATSVSADVTITFDGEAWSEPAACDWECDSGFDEVDGACLDEQTVACDDSETPDNATAVSADVTIEYDGTAWSEPEACAWECDSGFDEVDGACLDTQMVACDDSDTEALPEHASYVAADVEITFDGTEWSEPAACDWECADEYGPYDGECKDTVPVLCDDSDTSMIPENAVPVVTDVTIDWDPETGTWSDVPACDGWTCPDGYTETEDFSACEPDPEAFELFDCFMEGSDEIEATVGDELTFGLLLDSNVTTDDFAALGLQVQWCAYSDLDGDYSCTDTAPDLDHEPTDDFNGRVTYTQVFEVEDIYDFWFEVSLGEDRWTCDTSDAAPEFREPEPALLMVTEDDGEPGGDDTNLGFELWTDGQPDGWSSPGNVTIEQSEDARTGAYAARLVKGSGNQGANEIIGGVTPVDPSTEYNFGAWFLDDTSATKANLGIQFLDASGGTLGGIDWAGGRNQMTTDDADWQYRGWDKTTPADAASVQFLVRLYENEGGVVLMDDVTITPAE